MKTTSIVFNKFYCFYLLYNILPEKKKLPILCEHFLYQLNKFCAFDKLNVQWLDLAEKNMF